MPPAPRPPPSGADMGDVPRRRIRAAIVPLAASLWPLSACARQCHSGSAWTAAGGGGVHVSMLHACRRVCVQWMVLRSCPPASLSAWLPFAACQRRSPLVWYVWPSHVREGLSGCLCLAEAAAAGGRPNDHATSIHLPAANRQPCGQALSLFHMPTATTRQGCVHHPPTRARTMRRAASHKTLSSAAHGSGYHGGSMLALTPRQVPAGQAGTAQCKPKHTHHHAPQSATTTRLCTYWIVPGARD